MLKIWPSSLETLLFNPGCFLISERKALRDDEILQNLQAGTTVTIYFRDLGPQIGWTKVRNGHKTQYYFFLFSL